MKYALVACCVLIVTLLGFCAVQSTRLAHLDQSMAEYRRDLEDARRANDRYADAFGRAKQTTGELGECLSRHTATIQQLREQIQAIRAGYEQMQDIIESLENRGAVGDSGTGGSDDICEY